MLGFFSQQAHEEYYSTGPLTLCSSSYDPTKGKATRVSGGYRISGHCDFSSGSNAASWFMLGASTEDGPRILLVPKDECEAIDTWFASGLAGRGINRIVAESVFVPGHRIHRRERGRQQ
jgi:3-hydroxy-9,10-secoandrosta-1,3,5(10)-triene-9,17-dione monooxygenase